MAHHLGKFLELNGLVVLAVGLVWGVYRENLAVEMRMLGVGVAIFLVGYFLERKAAGRR